MDKWDPNVYVKKVKRRFLVLTHESLHYFKRSAGADLFGEEVKQHKMSLFFMCVCVCVFGLLDHQGHPSDDSIIKHTDPSV